jgi:tRNA1(Val) A37 N6-methylase TrmN6
MEKDKFQEIAKELNKKFGKPEDFKFDYCISNPPYQQHINGKRAQPIYIYTNCNNN